MYKVISNIDFSVIWSTKDRQEAIAIAKKYQASVYQKDKKILDFSQEDYEYLFYSVLS